MQGRREPAAWRVVAALVAVVALAAACAGGDRDERAEPGRDDRIVVASFNFDESRLLAEIYAQVLEDHGIAVRRELDLGPRELVLPALAQGHVDVVPEYLGSLARTVVPAATAAHPGPGLPLDELDDALSVWGLRRLASSDASNHNALVVTRDTADEHDLTTISDLVPLAGELVLGGPPECPERDLCLRGLEAVYGLHVADFVPLPRARLVAQALRDGVIDVGVLFSTDGELASDDLVVLDDDRALQPPEPIVPLVRAGAVDERAAALLDEVSAALTTAQLRVLGWRVTVGEGTPAAEAHGWLVRTGLVEEQAER